MSKLITTLMAFVAFACGIVLLATAVSAYPYQLNLTDGTLIDLNTTSNMTNNITIYVLHDNATIINNTLNNTYVNNTYINNTNSTYYIWNGTTNSTFDERFTLFDARYVEETDFSSYKTALLVPTKTEFDALKTQVNNINVTAIDDIKNTSHGGLWTIIVITFIIALAGLLIGIKIIKDGVSENESYTL